MSIADGSSAICTTVCTYLASLRQVPTRAYLVVGSSERLCRPQHKVAFLRVEPHKSRETTLCEMGGGGWKGWGYNGMGREEREGYGWRCDGMGGKGKGSWLLECFFTWILKDQSAPLWLVP